MSETICGIEFDGIRSTIQHAKPMVETYTRLGDDRIWVQKVNTSSSPSNLQAWKVFNSLTDADAHIKSIIDKIGIRGSATVHSISYNSAYIIDSTPRMRQMAGDKVLVEYDLIVVTDARVA